MLPLRPLTLPALLGAALLAACASPMPADPARAAARSAASAPAWQRAPADLAGAADAATLAGWWRGLNDPVLDGLIDEALAANLDLRVAQANLARARALREAGAAGLLPQLGSSASAARNRSGGQSTHSVALGLDASWEPDVFGGQHAALRALQAQAEASAASAAGTRIAVLGEVALGYLQWHGQRRQIALAEENLALQRDSLAVAQWRHGAGLASALDVEQARGSVAQTAARLPALRSALQQNEHRLALLLGLPPGSLDRRLASAGPPPGLPPLPALGLPADLLRRRPDVLAAEWTVQAALATLDQRQAARLPQFSISGRLGLQALTLAALGGSGTLVSGLSATVSWPVFDGGAARAQVAAQQAALDAANASYLGAVLLARQDVEDTLSALVQGQAQLQQLAEAASAEREVLRLARLRYQAGTTDFSVLLDAQRSAVAADDSLAQAGTELALNQVRLYKALGGGWPAAEAVTPPPLAAAGR
ncbi:efflux transporter outer membrane subunit [Aquabacterium sp.]|uniref:efflux transporter outer membrane subunit n=1 Tax=Aquabacterium sp. TaxID=1872578 RepID=UPI0037834542